MLKTGIRQERGNQFEGFVLGQAKEKKNLRQNSGRKDGQDILERY